MNIFRSFNQNTYVKVRLCEPVTFTRNIAPACLPSSSSNNYDSVAVSLKSWRICRRRHQYFMAPTESSRSNNFSVLKHSFLGQSRCIHSVSSVHSKRVLMYNKFLDHIKLIYSEI